MYEIAKLIVAGMHAKADGKKLTDLQLKGLFMTALKNNNVRLEPEMAELCEELEYGIWAELNIMNDLEIASEISEIIEE